MDKRYKEAFAALNREQRQAVETLDGPVLVIAGPGTGKTQLISTRVGQILQKTDTPADAILLLTFTEAGVEAMRQRLSELIGKPAYDVQLSTYHAFGGEIFRRYPEYFEGARLRLIEELSSDAMLRSIISKLPYSNPLKFADNYINELRSFISEAKRALLTPEDITNIAQANLAAIKKLNQSAKQSLDRLDRVSRAAVPLFEELLQVLRAESGKQKNKVLALTDYAAEQLAQALSYYSETAKTTSLSEWKRQWLAKDEAGRFIFAGQRQNDRLAAAGKIYKTYQRQLDEQNLYDYDDMILRAISTLQDNPELKYSLAERYSYIMLDEFQDTNPAQFRLVQLLTDHPVNEGRPNVLAVGDDDQAIYAFQGAEHANMAAFANYYRDVKVISLRQNYRSHAELVEIGQNIAAQINQRLHYSFADIDKQLVAAAKNLPGPPLIAAHQFRSDAAQYQWIATEIKSLIKKGLSASEIAVIAPKHRYLEPLLPYLADYKLPVRYERRENILDEPLVRQLERMSQLALALADGDETTANVIWPEVLSYDFWEFPTDKIWRMNWQVRESHEPWTAQLLSDDVHSQIAGFFLKLASLLPVTSLEQQMDALIGIPDTASKLNLPLNSPVYSYYFSKQSSQDRPLDFIKLISDLNVLRDRLNTWRQSASQPAGLRAFIEFSLGHRAAGLNVLNTSPYHETENAVEILTAYGSKGREFQAVFIVGALDEVWGSASRNQGYRLGLPANLTYIRYQGASEDERLRLLFVAATRAKTRLYITSYDKDLAGKRFTPLKYLDVSQDDKGQVIGGVIPKKFQKIHLDASDRLTKSAAANYWQARHLPPLSPKLIEVLAPRLRSYKLNATDLNKFTDLLNGGPDAFFMSCLLKFPSSPTAATIYGTAIHNTLRFIGRLFYNEGAIPSEERILEILKAQLDRVELGPDEINNLFERGQASLRQWLAQRGSSLARTDRYEYGFGNEGSSVGDIRLGGVVDRLVIDEKTKAITVIDYKIGQSYRRWQTNVVKLYNFRKQLMFYKLLIESSARFRKYHVTKGIIEFVEPDERGRINQLELNYDQDDLNEMVELMSGVWRYIQTLELPDISGYQPSLAGIKKFEADIVSAQKAAPASADAGARSKNVSV